MTHNRPLRLAATALLALEAIGAWPVSLPGQVGLAEEVLDERRVRYGCHGEFDYREITALFFNQTPAEVILLWGDSQGGVRLLQQRSASGARYSDGVESFWIKGDTATYKRGGLYQCKVIKRAP